jgi:quercetin dioxygenase-like cupin family protein
MPLAMSRAATHRRDMDVSISNLPTIFDPDAIDRLPWLPLGPMEGVVHKVLWHNDTSMAGVLKVDAGHHLGAHTHRVNHHHMWVLDGYVRILGADLSPGSYVHIPSGVEHDIDASASGGCTVFYLYLRQGAGGADEP